jgi:GT2 family glycosyltransferase
MTRTKFPQIEIIQNDTNIGFSRGANQGIEWSVSQRADYVLILNNDIVLEKNFITGLVLHGESSREIGIVGPKILRATEANVIQDIGFSCDFLSFPTGLYSGLPDSPKLSGSLEVMGVSGCAMLIKTDVLKRIDPFDSDYFIFMEDVDLCWRARLAGFNIIAVADIAAYHVGGATVPGGYLSRNSYETTVWRTFLREKNSLTTILKNYSNVTLCWVLPVYALFLSVEIGFFSLVEPRVALSYIKGVLWNFTHLRQTIVKRRRAQSCRRVADHRILDMMSKKSGKVVLFKKVGIPRFARQ